jgi:hypothetical protein
MKFFFHSLFFLFSIFTIFLLSIFKHMKKIYKKEPPSRRKNAFAVYLVTLEERNNLEYISE